MILLTYEKLLHEAHHHSVDTYEKPMTKKIKGLYADRVIWINKDISTIEKYCTLAEELGHYHTTEGCIIDQSKLTNRKQEIQARRWAYKKLVPFSKMIEAYHEKISSKHEFAEFLGVTEMFLLEAVKKYKEEFGAWTIVDNYIVYFEPFGVAEMYSD